MHSVNKVWDFFQYEILGMKWLDRLINRLLEMIGLDTSTRVVSSFQFFIYDVIKITILLCILIYIISFIQSYFPPERSKKILTRFKGVWANLIAALLGTVTPFCSCSSIPLFIGFTSAGLPIGVTFSFLISSPMVDLASVVLLMSIFGVKVALIYVVLGIMIGVVGGTIIENMGMEDYVEDFIKNGRNIEMDEPDMTISDRTRYALEQVKQTLKKVFLYIIIGVGIGAIIHGWIPADFIEVLLGKNKFLSVVIAVFVGVPMYADIFGTIPVAEALLSKGAYLGTILAFMMAVTTLSLPSIIMLKKAIKPRLLILFISICTVGIIIVGYLFNVFSHIII